MLRTSRTLPTLALAFTLALTLAAAAPRAALAGPPEIVAVAVGESGDLEAARALQVLALQALQARGLATLDPAALRRPVALADARDAAGAAGAQRLFVLDAAPLGEAVVTGLAEVDGATGAARARSTLVIDDLADADRAIGRLVDAVLDGVPIDETARIATVTRHEGRAYSKRPGEFLWGLSVMSAVGLADRDHGGAAAAWGGSLHFLYEIPSAQFGVRVGGGGSEDAGLAEFSVTGSWMILDGDISPYVGGGLGLSVLSLHDGDGEFGGHALLTGGVEFFRLHSARIFAGLDLLLPFYRVSRWEDAWDHDGSDGSDGYENDRDRGAHWTPALMLSVGVLF
jgi:hypothetical protein